MIIIDGGIQSGRTAYLQQMAKMMIEDGQHVEIITAKEQVIEARSHRGFHSLHNYGLAFDLYGSFGNLAKASEKASEEFRRISETLKMTKVEAIEDYDQPVNFCHGEQPPKQKKFRSFVPDKRMINRRKRKSKRK